MAEIVSAPDAGGVMGRRVSSEKVQQADLDAGPVRGIAARKQVDLLLPPDLTAVDNQRINFWIHERRRNPNQPLRVGCTYTGYFRVGDIVFENLAIEQTHPPTDDVPPDGLGTVWLVRSSTVVFHADPKQKAGIVEVTRNREGDESHSLATFELQIPGTGNSEDRTLLLTPLTSHKPRIDVMVLAGNDVYREAVIHLRVAEGDMRTETSGSTAV